MQLDHVAAIISIVTAHSAMQCASHSGRRHAARAGLLAASILSLSTCSASTPDGIDLVAGHCAASTYLPAPSVGHPALLYRMGSSRLVFLGRNFVRLPEGCVQGHRNIGSVVAALHDYPGAAPRSAGMGDSSLNRQY